VNLFRGEGHPLPLRPEKRVLVIGSGRVEEAAAEAVRRAGGEPVSLKGDLEGLSGLAGGFRVVVNHDGQRRTGRVGAVVLAGTPAPWPGPLQGLEELDQGLGLSLRELDREPEAGSGRTALLTGFWSRLSPDSFGLALEAGLRIMAGGGLLFLFTPQAKVAGPGLEELYRELRLRGAVVTRLDRPPALEPAPGKVGLRFLDPILDQEVRLEVERLVFDPPLGVPEEIRAAGLSLDLLAGPDQGPNPDNVLFPPPLTSRAGVFAVGRGLEVKDDRAGEELELLTEELGLLLGSGDRVQTATRLASDRRQCALCLTCLRTCPVQAIGWDSGPVVLESACLSCGQCAAVCPAAVIEPLWEEEEGLKALLLEPGSGRLVLACGRVSPETLARLPEGVRTVRLSCAGRVSPGVLLALLGRGYGRVVVAACHPGNCRSLTGSARAGQVVAEVRDWLSSLGLPASTVSYVPLAPHQHQRLLGALGAEEKR